MAAVISFMFMVFVIILVGNNIEDAKTLDEDYEDSRRYLNKKDEFLKEVEEYDKSKASKSRRH